MMGFAGSVFQCFGRIAIELAKCQGCGRMAGLIDCCRATFVGNYVGSGGKSLIVAHLR